MECCIANSVERVRGQGSDLGLLRAASDVLAAESAAPASTSRQDSSARADAIEAAARGLLGEAGEEVRAGGRGGGDSIFGIFSGLADGERRGLDRIGG